MKEESSVDTSKNSLDISNRSLLGAILAMIGAICLIVWGMISIFSPASSAQIAEASMIRIDGNGIFLILCVLAISFGAWLLLKNKKS